MILRTTLCAAVPLWIEQLRRQPMTYVLERAAVCGQHVAEHGDVLQYKTKTKGASADAFNRLAEGLACLALTARGGVTFLGEHFEAQHPDAP
jgi:hypothetical protein